MSNVQSTTRVTFPIKTPPATLCFPSLFVPRAPAPGAEPRYSCVLLFDKAAQELPAYKNLRLGVFQVLEEKFGPKAKEMIKQIRLPFRDAGEKEYAGFTPGSVYINPWSKEKRQIIDLNNQLIIVPGDVWAGQIVRAAVRPFFYDTSGNKGVSFGLDALQVIEADKPRLDGRLDARTLFDDGAYPKPGNGTAKDDNIPF